MNSYVDILLYYLQFFTCFMVLITQYGFNVYLWVLLSTRYENGFYRSSLQLREHVREFRLVLMFLSLIESLMSSRMHSPVFHLTFLLCWFFSKELILLLALIKQSTESKTKQSFWYWLHSNRGSKGLWA